MADMIHDRPRSRIRHEIKCVEAGETDHPAKLLAALELPEGAQLGILVCSGAKTTG